VHVKIASRIVSYRCQLQNKTSFTAQLQQQQTPCWLWGVMRPWFVLSGTQNHNSINATTAMVNVAKDVKKLIKP